MRLAETAAEIDAAQALRYRVFYEEMGAGRCPDGRAQRRDRDRFDPICDHLLVLDHSRGSGAEAVVGTYRLIRREAAARLGGFYSAAEYDIAPLIAYPGEILELGRSCVDAAYRAAAGHAAAVARHRRLCVPLRHRADVRLRQPAGHRPGRAGRAALLSVSPPSGAAGVAAARAARALCRDAPARPGGDRPERAALAALPPLIKGYLRLGGFVGDGAVIDHQFNTTDVCIVVKTDLVTDKYSRHYERQSKETWAA